MPPIITAEVRGLEEIRRGLDALGREAIVAVVRAINRTQGRVRTRLIRWVVAATGVRPTRVRKSMQVRRATRGHPEALVSLHAGRVRLGEWSETARARHMPTDAFWVRRGTRAGGTTGGIFERHPRARARRIRPGVWWTLPIRPVFGPPLTEVLTDVGLSDLVSWGGRALREQLEHEIAYLLEHKRVGAS